MKNNLLLIVIISLLIGVSGFFAGMKYQQGKQPTFSRQFGRERGAGRPGSRQTIGEIISRDDKSITVKLQDGSTKIVLFSETTVINKAVRATIDDLKNGERVAVFGTENTDGFISAQNIQLNPMLRRVTGIAPTN
jgi:hypothetical protein